MALGRYLIVGYLLFLCFFLGGGMVGVLFWVLGPLGSR